MRARHQLIAAVAALTVSSLYTAQAATLTFTGTTAASNTNAVGSGVYNYGAPYGYAGPVTTYTINASGTNLSGSYALDDELLFDGSASGSVFHIAVDSSISALANPSAVRFNDAGGAGKTYIFARASTSAGSSTSLGFSGGTAGLAPNNVDTYNSTSLFGATTPTSGSTSLILESGFTGKVILRRAAISGSATGTTTINGGTLELQDAGALPTTGSGSTNNPGTVTLNGGTLAINVNIGNEETVEGNRNPSTGQLAGTLAVTADSTLANAAINFDGSPRRQDLWGGSGGGQITLSNGVTLNVQTGGGASIRNAINVASPGNTATINLGNSSAYLRLTTASGGNAGVRYNLGTGTASLDLAASGTYNLGNLLGGNNTALRGGTAGITTASIGALNESSNYGGRVLNGFGSSNGGTPPTGTVRHLAVTKVGTGTLTLSGDNNYSGATTVNAGTLRAGSTSAFGDSASNITVNSNATLDLNGFTQEAGKSFVLAGGSLVNNGSSAVTIGNGASAHVNDNASGSIYGPGTITGTPSTTGSWSIDGGTTPTVTLTGGGGSGATAIAKMQLGWLRTPNGTYGTQGSGYTKAPKLIFSAPDDPNGRQIVAYAQINPATGVVSGIQIVDPGFGYTKVPTLTIDNTGTGGSGFAPVFAMQVNEIKITNAGTGYTSAPTVAFSNLGTLYNPGSAGSSAGVAPVGTGGWGQVTVNSTSNIGGSGNINVTAAISGAGGLNKIGSGTVTFSGTNTYDGATDIQAGKLLVNGSNNGTGAVTVQSGAILGGSGSIAGAVTANAGGTVSPGNSIGTLTVASATINGTLLSEYDATGSGSADVLAVSGLLTLGASSVLDLDALAGPADDGAYVIATYGTLAGTFGSVLDLPSGYSINYSYGGNSIAVVIPEPATLGLLGLGSLLGLRRRRV